VAIALVSALLYQLQKRGVIPPEDIEEVFDASLLQLEGMPPDDPQVKALRRVLEQAAKRVGSQGNQKLGQ
jgi:hypothetical protein